MVPAARYITLLIQGAAVVQFLGELVLCVVAAMATHFRSRPTTSLNALIQARLDNVDLHTLGTGRPIFPHRLAHFPPPRSPGSIDPHDVHLIHREDG
jgi:hypothetical protein